MNDTPVSKRFDSEVAVALMVLLAICGVAGAAGQGETQADPAVELGQRLFAEQLFTNPAADYQGSCAGCHKSGSELADRTPRVFADYTPLSLLPRKTTTLRNTPTLLDSWRADRLGADGEYTSLESLIEAKLLGSYMGWESADRQRAAEAIQFTLQNEGTGGGSGLSYLDHVRQASGIDLDAASAEQAVGAAASAIATYVRTLSSSQTSRWDAFAEQNRLKKEPTEGQDADGYAFNLESRIGNQEGRRLIRRPEGFSEEAYEGFKIFFRVFGEEGQPVGNCVACHTPPTFTDGGFHNVGTAQARYERVHGEGSLASYATPGQPSETTRAEPVAGDAAKIDLGWWNFAPETERESAFGAFKTPTLRNLAGTDPYLHDGSAASLEDVVARKIELSRRARAGEILHADPDVLEMHLGPEHVGPLVAFLRMLEDVGEEDFRYYLIHFDN